jgi:hypothetical protein
MIDIKSWWREFQRKEYDFATQVHGKIESESGESNI